MDDNAKLTWMRNNYYDPTGDSCRQEETCVVYFNEDYSGKYQSCQICDETIGTTLEIFNDSAPSNEPESTEDTGGDDGDADAEPREGEEVNAIDGEYSEFYCLEKDYISEYDESYPWPE